MPELPEVETVVRDLWPMLVGRTIQHVVCGKRKLRRPWKPAWSKAIAGLNIESVRRRGKWILLDLSPSPRWGEGLGVRGTLAERKIREPEHKVPVHEGTAPHPQPLSPRGRGGLLLHLGMTGQLTVVSQDAVKQDHTHLIFSLDNATELRFRDVRRFGSADWFGSARELEEYLNEKLGPEPFELTSKDFAKVLCGSVRSLKAILLDQAIIAGVGNIYADEACFLARLHPGRLGKSLTSKDCSRLLNAIVEVLTKAIEGRGSTIKDYIGGSGLMGTYQGEFRVYGRTGEPCMTCQTLIQMERLAGRSSHYCPKCQK